MAQLKSKQLTYPLSGSFTGSLFGTASYALSGPGGGGGGTPGGNNYEIQYNNNNAFGGVPVLTYSASILVGTGSFSGSFIGLIDSASYAESASHSSTSSYSEFSVSSSYSVSSSQAESASYYQETDPIFVEKSASLATTGSNTFTGPQIITNVDAASSFVSMSYNEIMVDAGAQSSKITPATIITKKILSESNTTASIAYGSGNIVAEITDSNEAQVAKTTLSFSQSIQDPNTLIENIITFQDGSGEVAFLSDITSSYLPITGGTLSGSLIVSGSVTSTDGFTGSLFGTASFATTASYSLSSSYAISSSYSLSSSYSVSSSYSLSSSYSISSSYSVSSSIAESSSYALTASYALQALSSSYSITASYSNTSTSASYALSSSFATTASYITSSNVYGPFGANSIMSASYSTTASSADNFIVRGQLTASGLNYPTLDNGEFSFMQTDGTGNLSFQYVNTIYEIVYNGESTQLQKGEPVYISGSQGANPKAYKADAGNPLKMPVIYVTADQIEAAQTGRVIALGLITGVNTTGYAAGTEIYVGVGGGWTSIRPTGSAIVQVLGYVTKEGAGGQGVVLNPGPANLPNLNSGSVWLGNSGSVPIAVPSSSLFVTSASYSISSSFASTASFAPDYVLNSVTSSMTVLNAITASFVTASNVYGPYGSNSIISSSYALTASFALNGGGGGSGAGFPFTGSAVITGSLTVTGSGTFTDSVIIDAVLMTSSLVTTGAGNTTLFTQATGSYRSMFTKYIVSEGVNARAGEFMAVWNAGNIAFTDTSTTDIGDTNSVVLTVSLTATSVQLSTSPGAGWSVKTQTTFI